MTAIREPLIPSGGSAPAGELAAALAAFAGEGALYPGTRVVLDDPHSVWLVEHGTVDVFAAEVRADLPLGVHRFLWHAEAPAVLCGIALTPDEDKRLFGVVAVGAADTRLRRVPLASARTRAERPETAPAAVAVVQSFVTEAAAAIVRASRVPVDDEAAAALSVDAAAAWRAGALWTALESFRALFSQWLVQHVFEMEASELGRLARKAETEQQMLRRSVVNLAGVMATAARGPVAADDGNALLAACRAVGAPKRIEFRAPPGWELDRRVRDPLAAICRASRVRQRKVALQGRWWQTSGVALLGFTADSQRPVALLPVGHSRYERYDPASDRRVLVDAAVAGGIEPFAFELYRPSPNAPMGLVGLGRLALDEARSDLPRLLFATLAGSLLGLVLPLATGNVFSVVIPMAVPANILPLLTTLVAFTLASTCFDLTRAMALIRIEGRTNTALQSTVIDRLLALPVPFFRNYSTGDLTLRAGAINAARSLLSGAALTTLLEGAFSVTNLALLLYLSWRLTAVAVVMLVLAVAFTAVFAVATVRVERRRQAVEGVVAGLIFEMINGIAKLRVAGAERRAFTVWAKRFREQRDLAYRAGVYENCVQVFNEVLPILSTLALLAAAGAMVARGTAMPTGDFIAFNAAFGSFFASGVQLSETLINTLNVVPMMERARPILEAPLEISAGRPDPGELKGRIEVSHVTFRYKTDGPPILRDVSLHAAPGEFIALVGPSGSGKSTLLRLLVGFEAPESGAIYFDEQDLAQVNVSAVRSQMGVVLQSSRLLAGDIFQNIIGAAPLTVDDAWAAAEKAGLAADIRRLPMGMYTLVSEGGSTLSGGQRQRLMIARALVRRPRIVLFDEATSALDNRTQRIVSRSLENMKATRIVIAHRLSTVRHADRIYAMESGQIVQQGTYDQLANEPGLFARLIARQLA